MYASLRSEDIQEHEREFLKCPHANIRNVFLNGWRGAILVLNVDR